MTADVRRLALGTLLPGFRGPALPDLVAERLRDGLAGVVLFGENIGDDAALRALTAAIRAARPDAVVAVDEEGGDVTRLHARTGSPDPGNAVLGRLDDEALTEASARAIGRELAAAGCTLDFAPTADANTNADNPVIGARSFGADARLVARHTAAWVRGLQSTGVGACAKHFPGHGDTAVDSHLGLPVVPLDERALRERELLPFVAAIDAGTAAIMTSHIVLPALDPEAPATLSRRILTGLLRDELGYEGVVVTDALDMAGASAAIGIPAAAVRSLAAGADLLCLGTRSEPVLDAVVDAIVAAVEDGSLPLARLEQAVARASRLPVPDRTGSALERPGVPVAAAFDVQPAAAAALSTIPSWTVVRLESRPNIAVGDAAWGPFAAVAADPGSPAARRFASWPSVVVRVDEDAPPPEVDGPVLVIGRDVHLHPRARAAVDALRAADRPVVVVDAGWPGDDRRYADVATWGASRAVGAALLETVTRMEP